MKTLTCVCGSSFNPKMNLRATICGKCGRIVPHDPVEYDAFRQQGIIKSRDASVKFRLKFKTPYVIDQLDELTDEQVEEAKELVAKFVKYGELVTIEFDTDTQTATVVEVDS